MKIIIKKSATVVVDPLFISFQENTTEESRKHPLNPVGENKVHKARAQLHGETTDGTLSHRTLSIRPDPH